MTIKINKKIITDAYRFRKNYKMQERERELIKRRLSEMPVDQMAVMGATEAAAYLDVPRSTLSRWHDRGVLTAIVNEDNGYKTYLIGHLWVFKMLWFEDQG